MKFIERTMDITFIRDFIDKIINDMNIDRNHLYGNGTIYYYNSNDGTDFDYDVNNRTCEFCVFYGDWTRAIKCYVTNTNIEAYIYPETNPYGGDYIYITSPLSQEFCLYELAQALFEAYDMEDRFNELVTNWIIKYYGIWD